MILSKLILLIIPDGDKSFQQQEFTPIFNP